MTDVTTQLPIDSRPAFLFRCGDSNLCAVTLNETGENLPKHECEDGWRLLQGFALGVQEPVPAWGLMLRGGAQEYAESAPWVAVFPGIAISLAVFGFNLFGDALRDWLDPKMKV